MWCDTCDHLTGMTHGLRKNCVQQLFESTRNSCGERIRYSVGKYRVGTLEPCVE